MPLRILYLFLLLMLGSQACNRSEKVDNVAEKNKNTVKVTEQKTTKKDAKTILFFGDSLTAGYGLELSQAFPALIQQKIDSLGLNFKVVNAGLSGETTASGKNRVAWVLKQKVDIFVLELGGNDGLRGIDPNETKANLQQIIDTVKEKYPQATIMMTGMEAPPNMGEAYTSKFRNIFKNLADNNKVGFIPFFQFLGKVAGNSKLNLPDGIHPTAAGHKIVANNLWKVLEDIVEE